VKKEIDDAEEEIHDTDADFCADTLIDVNIDGEPAWQDFLAASIRLAPAFEVDSDRQMNGIWMPTDRDEHDEDDEFYTRVCLPQNWEDATACIHSAREYAVDPEVSAIIHASQARLRSTMAKTGKC